MLKFTNILNKIFISYIPPRFAKLVKYIISGGTAAVTDLAFLYLFTSILHVWYLISAVVAFIISFAVSFTLQKFWTFNDQSIKGVKSQVLIYFTIAVVNLGINTLLMYAFVDILKMYYFTAQILAGALVALQSYFIYQKFVFRNK